MNNTIANKQILDLLSPRKIGAYLQGKFWHQKSKREGITSVWTKENKEIVVPLDVSFTDYAVRLSEMLFLLEVMEKRSQDEIFKDIFAVDTDIIRIRASSIDDADGSIPMISGIELITHAEHLISASANAAYRKQAIYRGKYPDSVKGYLESVRLGQTEHGSFVATFQSPLPAQQTIFTEIWNPYERNVTKTLVHSIKKACEVSKEYLKLGKINIFQDAISDGVSSNLCEAVVGLAEAAPIQDINVNVAWSPLIPNADSGHAVISQQLIPAIREGQDYLKIIDVPEVITLEGYVLGLSKEKAFQMADGTINITTYIDGKPRRVRINISETSHRLAIQAYEDGMLISCTGKLVKHGRFWHLIDSSDLSISNSDTE